MKKYFHRLSILCQNRANMNLGHFLQLNIAWYVLTIFNFLGCILFLLVHV